MAIYGFDGNFGSYKTCSSVYLAYFLQSPKTAIISNVKMSNNFIKNYFYFSDDEFLPVLRTIHKINTEERTLFSRLLPSASGNIDDDSIRLYNREAFTKFIVIYDELGATASSTDYRDYDTRVGQYILQCRKMNADLIFISQKITRVMKALRENIDWVLYAKPFWDFWLFKYLIVIRKKKIDDDGKTMTESYLGKDSSGEYVKKETPLDFYVRWYYALPVYQMYDDWHMNIKDDSKHEVLDRIYDSFKFRESDITLSSDLSFLQFLKFVYSSIFKKKEVPENKEENGEAKE